ncbi:hypothetical protein AB7M35_003521 [Amorphus suaedae]
MLRLAYSVPLFGWLLRDAVQGPPSSRGWFVANLAMIWFLAIVFLGYPAFIWPVLFAAAAMLTGIVALTTLR